MEPSIAVSLMRQLAYEQLPTLHAMCCMTMIEEGMPLNLRIFLLKKYACLFFCVVFSPRRKTRRTVESLILDFAFIFNFKLILFYVYDCVF